MHNMVFTIILTLLIFCVFALPIKLKIEEKKSKKNILKEYNKIQIGDKLQCRINTFTENPFEDEYYIFEITITDKSLNKEGIPYVKYKYNDGSIGSDTLEEILNFRY